METKRGRGRPRSRVAIAELPEDRSTWTAAHWEEMLVREGLAPITGSVFPARNIREADNVVCADCRGYHTFDPGCARYGEEG